MINENAQIEPPTKKPKLIKSSVEKTELEPEDSVNKSNAKRSDKRRKNQLQTFLDEGRIAVGTRVDIAGSELHGFVEAGGTIKGMHPIDWVDTVSLASPLL
jgi:hypothetical protein